MESRIQGSVVEKLNLALAKLGLDEWRAVWSPDPSSPSRGLVLPAEKTILIHDPTFEGALSTLVHEAIEIRLRRVLGFYRELVNGLIGAFEKAAYLEKERAIESLVPILVEALKPTVAQSDTPTPCPRNRRSEREEENRSGKEEE